MKASHTTIVIHVSDLSSAVSYYTTILGFSPDFEYGDYVGLTYGDVGIHLCGPSHQGVKKLPGNAHFFIYSDDINDYYELISQKGAIISVPIADRLYGLRDFAVDDEDGNTLVFGMEIR
ncbi:VOC family protein [Mucilaginibacter ginsenosidivorax]|uniref:VOC domain-containing protein n=1 Tax=Mucilaginibacter ginsenosidivorax TaxID=862126 RepID=A0A5B8W2N2_9SPHI|nr:VOC family protein [Mucilaginibacter ginsenosidivorax]QEC77983.1 hypothetical protein FSB76_19325 [Mucilaginibacter ginsenosidivorax]